MITQWKMFSQETNHTKIEKYSYLISSLVVFGNIGIISAICSGGYYVMVNESVGKSKCEVFKIDNFKWR